MFVLAIVVVAYLISLAPQPRSVFAMGIWCFSGFSVVFSNCFFVFFV